MKPQTKLFILSQRALVECYQNVIQNPFASKEAKNNARSSLQRCYVDISFLTGGSI